MIPCRRAGIYCCKSSIISSFSSQSLFEELKIANDQKDRIPKTFPVEVRTASSPPVIRNEDSDRFDKAVLEALSKANQKAAEIGRQPIVYSSIFWLSNTGNLADSKRAGYELAEQFIMKYPESFKVRWSDKMSLGKITAIEEICREKNITKAREIFLKLEDGDENSMEDKKKDLTALLDLFAFHNASTEDPELTMTFDKEKGVFRYDSEDGSKRDLPYTRSLYKTREAEYRNLLTVVQDLLKPHICPELNVGTKKRLLEENIESVKSRATSTEEMNACIPSMRPHAIGRNLRLSESERVKNKDVAASIHDRLDYAPPVSPVQYISVMNEQTALCLRVLELAKLYNVVTSQCYDSIVQSAVKFYRPDLAWKYYMKMRSENFFPSQDTLSDLIYSITHDMDAMEFIRIGASEKIKVIMEDIALNPNASLNDDIFLNLFYGVHINAQHPGNNKKADGKKSPDLYDSIDKYNNNIFDEMTACLKKGMFRLRFSSAYSLLMMNNLQSIGDQPVTQGKLDINNKLYDLFNDNPDLFIRDYENTESTGFLPLLLRCARESHPVYDIDTFYTTHLHDLQAIGKTYRDGSTNMMSHYNKLDNILLTDLHQDRGKPFPRNNYSSLAEIRKITPFDFYKDFYKDNLNWVSHKKGIFLMKQLTKMLECLDPYTANIDEMFDLYAYIINETVWVSDNCKKMLDEWNVELFTFLQEFFESFHIEYLMKFSTGEKPSAATYQSKGQQQKMVLSERNILKVVTMTAQAIDLLVKNGGMPTVIMMYVLVCYTLKSGEYPRAWQLIGMYQDYNIPLEGPALLKFIEHTPDWESQRQNCLGMVKEPLRSRITKQIDELEEKYKQDIISLSELQRYHVPYTATVKQHRKSSATESALVGNKTWTSEAFQ